jgi:hypothetical protein
MEHPKLLTLMLQLDNDTDHPHDHTHNHEPHSKLDFLPLGSSSRFCLLLHSRSLHQGREDKGNDNRQTTTTNGVNESQIGTDCRQYGNNRQQNDGNNIDVGRRLFLRW